MEQTHAFPLSATTFGRSIPLPLTPATRIHVLRLRIDARNRCKFYFLMYRTELGDGGKDLRRILATLVLWTAARVVLAANLHGDLDSGKLDGSKWTSKQILPHQQAFIKPGRCGDSAIQVTVFDEDGGEKCDDDCQRAEQRTAEAFWPKYGDEVWFLFSFRIIGSVPNSGSHRTIIGQWKGPGDQGPLIAQRLDNNVFHITVQDKETRRVIAEADGDPEALMRVQALLDKLDPKNEKTDNSIRLIQSLNQANEARPGLGTKLLNQDFSNALKDFDGSQSQQSLGKALNLPDPDMISQFSAMSFVAEPEKYLGAAELVITPEKDKLLPDPRKGWVDMIYRVKPGRTDNQHGPIGRGEVDVWENGEKIVSVKGNIGATQKKDSGLNLVGPYFKFGTHRIRMPNRFSFDFDEFLQAWS